MNDIDVERAITELNRNIDLVRFLYEYLEGEGYKFPCKPEHPDWAITVCSECMLKYDSRQFPSMVSGRLLEILDKVTCTDCKQTKRADIPPNYNRMIFRELDQMRLLPERYRSERIVSIIGSLFIMDNHALRCIAETLVPEFPWAIAV